MTLLALLIILPTILLLARCLGNKLAERRAVELHWRRMVVRRAQKLNGRILM